MSKTISLQSVSPEEVIMNKIMIKSDAAKADAKWKRKMFKIMDGNIPQLFLGVLLLLSLFISESWVLGNAPDSSNDALYSILVVIFAIFCVEVAVLSVIQKGYFLGFFFWMDVIGTLSIILDIGWIADTFLPQNALAGQGSVIRATRTAKLGARYGRLLRLMRMMRFLKVLPCFGSKDEDDYEPTMKSIKKVSSELSNELSQRTALLVLILIIVEPFLAYTVYDYSVTSWIMNLKMLGKNETTTAYDIDFAGYKMRSFYETKDDSLLSLRVESPYIPSTFYEEHHTRDVLRHDNIVKYKSSYEISNATLAASSNPYALAHTNAVDSWHSFTVTVEMDATVHNQMSAMFGILIIVLTIVMLFTFTASFNSTVSRLVVRPLEQMMTTLRNSAMVMLTSMKAIAAEKEENDDTKKKAANSGDDDDDSEEDDDEMETAMLENMVEKLARIVKHVMPGAKDIALDENVDKTTANWLSESYTTGTNKTTVTRDNTVYDETAEKVRLQSLETSLQNVVSRETLDSWDFDVLEYSNEDLCQVVTYMFSILDLLHEFKVPKPAFQSFLKELSGRYVNSNTYHNFKHGVDVCHTSYRLMMIPSLNDVFTSMELFSVLVGALAHDVGHPGVNNVYLVKAKDALALKHNDKSPLENMHCVLLYEILGKDETNIFVNLSEAQWRESRKIILTIILGTDMSHHFEQISKTQLFLEVNGEDVKSFCSGASTEIACMKDEKNRMFVMELVLHCSDISNPFKPYALCAKWADLVVEEFCLQGDRERSEGLEISPMCDRSQIVLCNMQMGFIEFVVAPLIVAFVSIFPPLHELGSNMLNNYQSWGERRKLEIMSAPIEDSTITTGTAASSASSPPVVDRSEECRKMDERLAKFSARMSFVNGLRDLPRRKRLSIHSTGI